MKGPRCKHEGDSHEREARESEEREGPGVLGGCQVALPVRLKGVSRQYLNRHDGGAVLSALAAHRLAWLFFSANRWRKGPYPFSRGHSAVRGAPHRAYCATAPEDDQGNSCQFLEGEVLPTDQHATDEQAIRGSLPILRG